MARSPGTKPSMDTNPDDRAAIEAMARAFTTTQMTRWHQQMPPRTVEDFAALIAAETERLWHIKVPEATAALAALRDAGWIVTPPAHPIHNPSFEHVVNTGKL